MRLRGHLFIANGVSLAVILVSVAVIYHYMLLSYSEFVLISSITVGAAVLSLIVHALLTRPLARWVRVLAGETERVAQGDFGTMVPEIGPHEFRVLASQFNRMSANLRDLFERLRASEAARSELIANVSHDLRTPMASIQSFVEALQDDVIQDRESFERYLRTIRLETQRLSGLIDDLFRLSRLEAGEYELTLQPEPVDRLIVNLLQSHYVQLNEKRLEVDVRLPEELPPVMADAFELERALGNLLQNAIRYSPEGAAITVEAAAAGEDRLTLSVADRGPGIDEAERARIFERFYRSDKARTRESGGGAGLGLAIARSIALRHGGEIGVDAREGGGSRFWLSIPASENRSNSVSLL